MARRVLPSAGMLQHVQSVTVPPPRTGGPTASSPVTPTTTSPAAPVPPVVGTFVPVVVPSAPFPSFSTLIRRVSRQVLVVLAFAAGFFVAGTIALVSYAWGQPLPQGEAPYTYGTREEVAVLAPTGDRGASYHTRPRSSRAPAPAWNALRGAVTFERLALLAVVLAALVRGRRTKGHASVEERLLAGGTVLPRSTPRIGAWTAPGNTRENNQDRVWIGRIAGVDVFIIADGLGGLPRGAEAAEFVVQHATALLKKELARALDASVEGVRTLLLSTVWSCALQLARKASKLDPIGDEIGMRTTLILSVALPDSYVSAWLGDGGVFVLPEAGGIVQALEPHKSPEEPDVLDASLGPLSDGRPGWSVAPRRPGDVLVAATDGIADIFTPAVAEMLKQELDAHGSDAEATAKAMVAKFGELRDERGQLAVTDNLTLALLITEAAP